MNNLFITPRWVKDIIRKREKTGAEYIAELKQRLSRFNPENPDVSVVIPAWNEGRNILSTLDSISKTETVLKCELIVVNNNSTDDTGNLLQQLGVKTIFEPRQGIAFARAAGLESAKGKYHLCADADTLYPPTWINSMVNALDETDIVCVYGRYSFIPSFGYSRLSLAFYEMAASVMIHFRKRKREFINVLGFNLGFVTGYAKFTKGFQMEKPRVFDNSETSDNYVSASEDGMLALRLKEIGRIKMNPSVDSRVWTMPRRLLKDGTLFKAVKKRLSLHGKRSIEYAVGAKI